MAWLQLLRLPNLFTAPGDSLAGMLLSCQLQQTSVNSRTLAGTAAVSLCLYAVGLIHNDVCDRAEDALKRPERPLPSGRIRPLHAVLVAVFLTVFAAITSWQRMNSTAQCCAALLFVTLICYNRLLKAHRLPGSLAMGGCRGLNLLMGCCASLDGSFSLLRLWPLAIPAVGVTLSIATVTWMADAEDRTNTVGPCAWMPFWIALLTWSSLAGFCTTRSAALLMSFALLAVFCFFNALTAMKLFRKTVSPKAMQAAIGAFLLPTPLFQASLARLSDHEASSAVTVMLIVCYVASRQLGRRFSSS